MDGGVRSRCHGLVSRRYPSHVTRGLGPNPVSLLAILAENLYHTPPPFERLVGDLSGAYSRRISIQHRLVYQILDDANTVKVLQMWTHYQ
jgi:Txe/YoeB family toxin of toxin-antitoxin system